MAEDKAALIELLKQIIGLWTTRDQRRAAKTAGKLRFWKDGMLKQLKQFADGKATQETHRSLRDALRGSEEDVTAAVVLLKKLRNNLGGGPVARAIDDVLNNENYGKESIRDTIDIFINDDMSIEDQKYMAGRICADIEALNVSLDRLQRLVYD
jgi:hypothetical protein